MRYVITRLCAVAGTFALLFFWKSVGGEDWHDLAIVTLTVFVLMNFIDAETKP